MSSLVISKPENYNERFRTAMKFKFEFSRKRKHPFVADTTLQVDQIKGEMEANFNKPFSI